MTYERFFLVLCIAFGFLVVFSALMFGWCKFVDWLRSRSNPIPSAPRVPSIDSAPRTLRSPAPDWTPLPVITPSGHLESSDTAHDTPSARWNQATEEQDGAA